MKKYILYIIIIIFFSNCKKNTERNSDVLSKEQFITILTDMHFTDGVLFASKLNKRMDKEKVSMYNYVFKKNDISRADFDATVLYYTQHTDKYQELYKEVLARLEKQKTEINALKEPEIIEELDSLNLWPLKSSWNLPQDGKTNPISYKIYSDIGGTYVIDADILRFTDDKSSNLRMTIMALYEDGTKDMNSIGTIVKDNKFHNYKTFVTINSNKELKEISGWILDHSEGTLSKHIKVKNIEIRRLEEDQLNKLKEKQKQSNPKK